MKVLLTGANGFIGSHLAHALMAAGNVFVGAVRDAKAFKEKFPGTDAFSIDLNTATDPEDWAQHLEGVDAIINCAGILQATSTDDIWAIHHKAPAALFAAAEKAKVKRVIQISAISADKEAGTDYALSKLAGDDDLRSRNLGWTVLRPSLVIAANSYGGTALLWKLARFPLLIPVVGQGDQEFQVVTMPDLCDVVLASLTKPSFKRKTMDVVGPKIWHVKDIVKALRPWLGKKEAGVLHIPLSLVKGLSRVADVFNLGPLRSTALKHMNYGNVGKKGSAEKLVKLLGRPLQTLEDFLARNPPDHKGR